MDDKKIRIVVIEMMRIERKSVFCRIAVGLMVAFLVACGSSMDDRIDKVTPGMGISSVIDILGTPYRAKRHPMGVLVLIYGSGASYHWVYFNEQPNMPVSVIKIERHPEADFFPSTDVQIIRQGKRIEFRENTR